VALLCLLGTTGGQLLFTSSAQALKTAPPGVPWNAIWTLGAALVLYGVTTLLWVWVLTKLDLARVYPLMAGSFVLVPISHAALQRTPLTWQTLCGAVIIGIGITVSVRGTR